MYSTKRGGPLNLSGDFYWGRIAQIQKKIWVFWKLQILVILKLSTILLTLVKRSGSAARPFSAGPPQTWGAWADLTESSVTARWCGFLSIRLRIARIKNHLIGVFLCIHIIFFFFVIFIKIWYLALMNMWQKVNIFCLYYFEKYLVL